MNVEKIQCVCVYMFVYIHVFLVSNDLDQENMILYATAFTRNGGLNMQNLRTICIIKVLNYYNKLDFLKSVNNEPKRMKD